MPSDIVVTITCVPMGCLVNDNYYLLKVGNWKTKPFVDLEHYMAITLYKYSLMPDYSNGDKII